MSCTNDNGNEEGPEGARTPRVVALAVGGVEPSLLEDRVEASGLPNPRGLREGSDATPPIPSGHGCESRRTDPAEGIRRPAAPTEDTPS